MNSTKDQKIKIKDLIKSYKKHYSLAKVGVEYGISATTVGCKLKDCNIINKPGGRTPHTCNYNFFSKDTPASFYWAGFIAADGCIFKSDGKYKRLKIEIADKDIGHLYKFKRAIGFSGNININRAHKKCIISIRSDKLFDDLQRFGVCQRKSLRLVLPKKLENHRLIHHFLRGYVDGDGCWYIRKVGSKKYLGIYILGTQKFLNSFRGIFHKNCNTSKGKSIGKKNSIYALQYNNTQQIKTIRNYLYKNIGKNIYLDRKKKIAYSKEITKPVKQSKPRIGINIADNSVIYLRSAREGKKYGFSVAYISKCCSEKMKSYRGYRWRYATKKEIDKYGLE